MEALNDIYHAAGEVEEFCGSRDWRFCFIGGIAVQCWGEPRLTLDADLTLFVSFGREEAFVDALLARFASRRPDAREFALARRVLLLESSRGVGIDVALGGLPFEERCVQRALRQEFDEQCALTVCSAEDLIVHKAFASRDRDWNDVDTIIRRQGVRLNRRQILDELTPLATLKEDPSILPKLNGLFEKRDRLG